MESAKQAVKDFVSRSGHHDTTVNEKVAPAVVHENVTPTRHEHVQTAVDKEVHQDHYHTSVQPVHHAETLPEKVSHNVVGVEKRHVEHGSAKDDEARLAGEAGQFRNERAVGDTKHTHSIAPTAAGEHIHHHVHETIQPVVQKETIQPSVVHTTVPIHEVHHNASQHHSTSALPAVSLEDFKRQGGTLGGREARTDGFEGEPRSVGGALAGGSTGTGSGSGLTGSHGTHGTTGTGSGLTGSHGTTGTGSGLTGSHGTTGTGSGLTGSHNTGSGLTGSHNTGSGLTGSHNTGSGLTGSHNTTGTGSGLTGSHGTTGTGSGLTGSHGTTGTGSGLSGSHNTSDTHGSSTTGKPTLGDRINPKKDADGDGRAGFMS